MLLTIARKLAVGAALISMISPFCLAEPMGTDPEPGHGIVASVKPQASRAEPMGTDPEPGHGIVASTKTLAKFAEPMGTDPEPGHGLFSLLAKTNLA